MTSLIFPGVDITSVLRPLRRRLVVVGDSRSAFPAPGAYSSALWWVWANALLGWPFEIAGVMAQSGWKTQDAVDHWGEVEALRASGPIDEIWLALGQNDIASRAEALAGLASMDALIALARQSGAGRIRLLTIDPNLPATMSAGRLAGLLTFNTGLFDRARGSVHVIDAGAALRDLEAASGAAVASLMADNVHANATGALRKGMVVAAALSGDVRPLDDFAIGNADVWSPSNGSEQLLANPMLMGSGGNSLGGAGGVLPAGWSFGHAAGAISGSASATEDLQGRRVRWLQMALGGSLAAPGYFEVLQQFVENIDAKGVTPGVSRLRGRVKVKTAGLSANFANLSLQIQGFDSGWTGVFSRTCLTESGHALGEFPGSATLEVPSFVVPAQTKHIGFLLEAQFGTGICAGTISVSEPMLRSSA